MIANSRASERAFGLAGDDLAGVSVAYPCIDEAPFLAVEEAKVAAFGSRWGAGEKKLTCVVGGLSGWKEQNVFEEALAWVERDWGDSWRATMR